MSETEAEGEIDEGFDDEPAAPDVMTSQGAPVERQATPDEPPASLTPARDDSDPGTSEG
jgi:hypothetical protein